MKPASLKVAAYLGIIEVKMHEWHGLCEHPAAAGDHVEALARVRLVALLHVVVSCLTLQADTLEVHVLHARVQEPALPMCCF